MSGAGTLLAASGVKVFGGGRTILDVASLELARGEALALLGPNGCGKTTLLTCLAGLRKPDAGTVEFLGEEICASDASLAYRRRVSVVFQEPLLLDATVLANAALGLKLRGVAKEEAASRAALSLKRFGVEHLAGRRARGLSGGEAQRVSLARAFAVNPEIIFLDEPFSALDAPTREELAGELRENLRETRVTAVFVTHDLNEALRLADRIAILNDGRLAQVGEPSEVSERPADEFVASFMGMETIATGRALASDGGMTRASFGGCEVEFCGEAEAGGLVTIGVRPENVTLSHHGEPGHTSARNVFGARVVSLAYSGPLCKVKLDCGFSLTALVTASSARSLGLAEGGTVSASVKATAVHLLRAAKP